MDDSEQSDWDDLVRRAAGRDEVAMSLLLVTVQPRIHRRMTRKLPLDIMNYIEPRDVVQEAFASAFKSISTLRNQTFGGFIAWLIVIADRHVAMTHRRYQALKHGGGGEGKPLSQVEVGTLMAFLCRNTPSPGSAVARQEMIDLIRQAMDNLDSDHRNVIRLRFLEGHDVRSTAGILKSTEGAIRTMTYRVLIHLRSLLPVGSTTGRGLGG